MTKSQETMARKINLAWKKWNDKAVKAAEKKSIKDLIEKLLEEHKLDIDWKTGKVTKATSKASSKASSKAKEDSDGVWTTRDLAHYISNLQGKEMTPKNLRRHLRKMDIYNDGKNTNYRWTGQDDPIVKEILEQIGIVA